MGLKILQGYQANRDYENDFFREFSSNLKAMFDEQGLDGILIGHPKVPENESLKPDCVLITRNRLVIIDFKNAEDGTEVWLPDEYAFEKAPWSTNKRGYNVGGGSTSNPFAQLKRQREWMNGLIGDIAYKDVGGIAAVVCFQHNVNVINLVPGRFQAWFSITNASQYLNRISDIIRVRNSYPVDIDAIYAHFDAEPYTDYFPVNLHAVNELSKASELDAKARKKEIEAEEKVKELEEKIKQAEIKQAKTDQLNNELKRAKKDADIAKQAASNAKAHFDEKQHELALETKRAQQAAYNAKKSANDKDREKIKSKTKIITAVIALIAVLIASVAGIAVYLDNVHKKEEAQQFAAEERERKILDGEVCISPQEVSGYNGKTGICVEYYVGYVGTNSNGWVYLNDKKNGTFVVYSKYQKILSTQYAKDQYLNKTIQVHGDIEQYKDKYEIQLYRLDQIKIKE